MNYPAKTPNIINSGLPVFLILLVSILTGCVDADGSKIYTSDTNKLHIYQPGDYIEYNIFGQRTLSGGSFQDGLSGTLRVEWQVHQALIDFADPSTPVEVLEELSTMKIGDETTQTRRLISQDPDTGMLYLHAIADTNTTDIYWVDKDLTTPPTNVLNKVPVLKMPLLANDEYNVDYQIFKNCSPTSHCDTRVGGLDEIHSFKGKGIREETRGGIFDTYRLQYQSGNMQATAGNTFPVPPDLRSSCNNTGATYGGYYSIYPELGVVLQSVQCTSTVGDAGFTYFIEFDHASASFDLKSGS